MSGITFAILACISFEYAQKTTHPDWETAHILLSLVFWFVALLCAIWGIIL